MKENKPKLVMRIEKTSTPGYVLLQLGELKTFSDGFSIQIKKEHAESILEAFENHDQLVDAVGKLRQTMKDILNELELRPSTTWCENEIKDALSATEELKRYGNPKYRHSVFELNNENVALLEALRSLRSQLKDARTLLVMGINLNPNNVDTFEDDVTEFLLKSLQTLQSTDKFESVA